MNSIERLNRLEDHRRMENEAYLSRLRVASHVGLPSVPHPVYSTY